MEDFEDEIIDLEDESDDEVEEIIIEDSVVSQSQTNNRQKVDNTLDGIGSETLQKMGVPKGVADKAIKKNGGTFSPANMPGSKAISNKARNQLAKNMPSNDNDSKKIQNILGRHPNIPSMPNNQSVSEQNKEENLKEQVEKKATSAALTAATGGALNGQLADIVASALIDKRKKIKKYIIIASIALISLIFLIIVGFIGGFSTNDQLGENTNGYVTGEMTEDELLEQLEYYGYCKDRVSCKQQGSYKFFEKLKEVYEQTEKVCSGEIKNDQPCDVTLNTALIIETINYYDNATDNFNTYDRTEEELNEKQNIFSSMISFFKKAFADKKQLDTMLGDIDELAIAQSEYVEESCRYLSQAEKDKDLKDGKVDNAKDEHKNYFYQISFDKYVSYLKYGTSSSHPNYKGKPVKIENEICQGPDNDYIKTNYDSNSSSSNLTLDPNTNQYTITGSGTGVEIANYALQFVGNPYVWGGTNLTTGVDCSGFTMKVMEHFGISLPHNANSQANYGTNMGTSISNALPGDLIVYNGHVAIYIGNNSIVHAANEKSGIKVSTKADYKPITAIVRLWG